MTRSNINDFIVIIRGLAVKCYLCSWSPNDQNNQTDSCTEENFNPNAVYSVECSHGCEAFFQWDSNGVLEHSRRNCMQNGVEERNSCVNETKPAWTMYRCTCDTDFCNTAAARHPSTVFYAFVIVIFWRVITI
ncbi:uncharacterized protein LOC111087302 [Limulus polyphemus]|uniref:Uncharacterized protein LOC111087302 n=1 Tax=Limulus polyphemus TaxID=6850 RepID=A0ABM1T008_LIMPO|nr:uncharacterized protein LOC111087302 [Limulus polyphemus]